MPGGRSRLELVDPAKLREAWAEGRTGLEMKLSHHLAYIDAWSLRLDWSIMLRTIPRVVTGKGAH